MVPDAFTFDGRSVPIEDGDTYASALHRAGVKVLSRSMKYHRPRGLYCCTGSCASCFVDVDGVPNTPACTERARPGATLTSQNRLGSARRDLLRVVDVAYPGGFDPHDAFTRPGPVNRLFVKAVRVMSGWGKAPRPGDPSDPAPVGTRTTHRFDELVVGGGQEGLLRAKHATTDGRRVLLVEEASTLGGSARWDPGETTTQTLAQQAPGWDGLTVWTDALVFGLYDGVAAVRRGDDLAEVKADLITLAPGRHDPVPLFPNNDLPGILSLRGAQRLWYEHGVRPGRRLVVHGDPLPERFAQDLQTAGAVLVAQGDVTAADGGTSVEKARVGDTWHRADTVVCNLPGVPRVELFQQAGCDLAWNDGPAPVLGDDGATSVPGVFGALGGRP